MTELFKSATKVVLLLLMVALVLTAMFATIYSVVTNNFSEPAKIILTLFGSAVTFVMGFFFGYKGDTNQPNAGK